MDLHMDKCRHGQQQTKCEMTVGIIAMVEALGCAQKQPIVHDRPIVMWRNSDPTTPAVVSDDDAGNDDDDTPPDPPMFFATPLFLLIPLI